MGALNRLYQYLQKKFDESQTVSGAPSDLVEIAQKRAFTRAELADRLRLIECALLLTPNQQEGFDLQTERSEDVPFDEVEFILKNSLTARQFISNAKDCILDLDEISFCEQEEERKALHRDDLAVKLLNLLHGLCAEVMLLILDDAGGIARWFVTEPHSFLRATLAEEGREETAFDEVLFDRDLSSLPMDYEEFRWALDDNVSIDILRQIYDSHRPMGDMHRGAMYDFRLYMAVGGMPQAVNTYLSTKDLNKVDKTKRNIIRLYLDDFQKLDPSGNAERLFLNIPAQLSGNISRYRPSSVVGEMAESKMTDLMQALSESKTTLFCHSCTDPNVGMSLSKDLSRYKIFLADTGLFVTLCFWDRHFTDNVIYNKLLGDKLKVNMGYVYENIVAQMLASAGNRLYYYTFPKDDKHNYEIDFLLSRGNKIVPIEVKSSGYKAHRSLDVFCDKYPSRIGERLLLYTKDYQKDGATTCLPVYFAPFL